MTPGRACDAFMESLELLDLDDVAPELFDYYQSARRAIGVGAR